MKKSILLLLLVSVMMGSLWAQQSSPHKHVKGSVKDAKTAEAIIGASVSIKGTNFGVSTDYEGAFSIKVTVPFPVTLVISYIGYQKQEILVASETQVVNVKLKENTRELREVAIKDTRITTRQKQAPLTVETMDAIAIKETPAANFYEGLAHLKGVDMTSASIGFKIINTRGFNSTSPVRSLQLIDGVDNQSPGLNFSLGNFLGASELDVQRVDLIVGASGAYYGPNAFNGVINMITKNPFQQPGLTVQLKMGSRQLTEMSMRYAEVFKNKKGEDKFAYKINLFAMSAHDWEATNYEKTAQSPTSENNPGGYDAVNIYGDEYTTPRMAPSPLIPYLGKGYTLRTGYKEIDLVDYNSRNVKLGAAFHYKTDKKGSELIYAVNFGNGTTIYQGDNRFSLKDILFLQNRLEWRRDNSFFIRAYTTKENAGNSFDAYSTALLLQNYAKSDNDWAAHYGDHWFKYAYPSTKNLIPAVYTAPPGVNYNEYGDWFLNTYYMDTLIKYHEISRRLADSLPSLQTGGLPRFDVGSARFDSAYQEIISRTNREGGSRFFDKSALYHLMGEKQFKIKELECRVGANFRLYAPNSQGTIFLDTAGAPRIYNHEVGGYLGLEYKFIDNKLKASFTNRLDKNQNFNLLWSPAASLVYTQNNHVFRISASSAIRNPTLTDQYINLNVGRATLLGNLNGFDSLVTVPSLITAFNYGRQNLEYFNVAPIKPEKVKTIELGYRTTLAEKLFADISWYYSWYEDFIGYKIGAYIDWPVAALPNYVKVYRVSANAVDRVTTTGFTAGINYFWQKYLGFNLNYSYNKLDRHGSTDPLIPAFNTPKNKYNIGINGRDINSRIGGFELESWGYGINWKWQEGFSYEGSPQFTGYVPAYGLLDLQVNKYFKEEKMTLKAGASNLLNNQVIQVYGGPRVGRLAYVSLLFDFSK